MLLLELYKSTRPTVSSENNNNTAIQGKKTLLLQFCCANITAYPPYLWQLIKWQPKHSSGFNSGMNKQTTEQNHHMVFSQQLNSVTTPKPTRVKSKRNLFLLALSHCSEILPSWQSRWKRTSPKNKTKMPAPILCYITSQSLRDMICILQCQMPEKVKKKRTFLHDHVRHILG